MVKLLQPIYNVSLIKSYNSWDKSYVIRMLCNFMYQTPKFFEREREKKDLS